MDLLDELGPVGLWRRGAVQLRHHVVVVGVKELGHVQGHDAFDTTRHRKVLVIAAQVLQERRLSSRGAKLAKQWLLA